MQELALDGLALWRRLASLRRRPRDAASEHEPSARRQAGMPAPHQRNLSVTDSLHEVLVTLGIPQASEWLAPHWQESMTCLPDEPPRFLNCAHIAEICRYGGLSAEVESLLCKTAETVRENPALLRLAWHCSRLVYEHLD